MVHLYSPEDIVYDQPLHAVHEMGLKTAMITGENQGTANANSLRRKDIRPSYLKQNRPFQGNEEA